MNPTTKVEQRGTRFSIREPLILEFILPAASVMQAIHKSQVLALRSEYNRRGSFNRTEFNSLTEIFSRYKEEISEKILTESPASEKPASEKPSPLLPFLSAFSEAVEICNIMEKKIEESRKANESQKRGNVSFVPRENNAAKSS